MADQQMLPPPHPHRPHQIVAPNRFKVLLRPAQNPNYYSIPHDPNPTNPSSSLLRISSVGNSHPNPNSLLRHAPAANPNPNPHPHHKLRYSSSSSAPPSSISTTTTTPSFTPADEEDEEREKTEEEEAEEEEEEEDEEEEEEDEEREERREERNEDDDDDEDLDADDQKPVKKRRKLEEVAAMAEARNTFHSNTSNTNATSSPPLLHAAPHQKKQISSLKERSKRESEQSGEASNGQLGEALSSKLLGAVIDKLQKKDTYGVFAVPVDPNEVPGYYDFIKSPMDFGTMRKKISGGAYRSLETFQDDIYLICSNAMTYNAKDTIYFKQARGIQDAARKILEALKAGLSLEGETKSQQLINVKRTPNRRILPNSFDYSGANITASLKGQHERHVMSSTNNLEGQLRMSYIAVSSPCDNRFEPQDSVPAFRSTNSKRMQHNEDNRRSSYQQPETLFSGLGPILAAFGGDAQQVMPMGYPQQDFAYARSLARFSADLGPAIWQIAAEKIRKALPPGVPFGPGWILEPPPGLLSPKSQSALMFQKMSTSKAPPRSHSMLSETQKVPNVLLSKNLSMHRSDTNHAQSLGQSYNHGESVSQSHSTSAKHVPNEVSIYSSMQSFDANHIVRSMSQSLPSVSKEMVESNPTTWKLPVTANHIRQSKILSVQSVSKSMVESESSDASHSVRNMSQLVPSLSQEIVESNPATWKLPVTANHIRQSMTHSVQSASKSMVESDTAGQKLSVTGECWSEDLRQSRFDNGLEKCRLISQTHEKQSDMADTRSEDFKGINGIYQDPSMCVNLNSNETLPNHTLFPSGPLCDHSNEKQQVHQNNNVRISSPQAEFLRDSDLNCTTTQHVESASKVTDFQMKGDTKRFVAISELTNFSLQGSSKVKNSTDEMKVKSVPSCLASLENNSELKSRLVAGHPILQEPLHLSSHCLPPDLNVSLISPSSHVQASSNLTDEQNPDLSLQL